MQQQIELEVAAREERGKNAARRLRGTGRVPAIVYGLGAPPQAVAIDCHEITNVLKDPAGHNRVFNLQSNGSSEHAMAVDYQIDPVKHSLLHVDLRRVDLAKPVTVSVPISAVGTAVGVKTEGGFEEMVNREVRVECLPLDIPEHIDVLIDDLHIGQSIRAKDIPASDKYKLADDGEKLLLHIMASRASADEDVVAEGEGEEDVEPAEGEPAE
ncbi:MAG: 50S ribosomal protein L25 [Bryobacterales bacterium]|nr:50S ribosomal protein L25 [Bryobacterales bacterium]